MQSVNEKTLQLNKFYGSLVKKLRLKHTNFSVNKLAESYDIARGNLSKIENGCNDPKLSTMWKISEAVGLKFSEIVRMLEEELGDDFKLIDE